MAPDKHTNPDRGSTGGLVRSALLEVLAETTDLVSVARADDDRLLWVNDAFLVSVGYRHEDVIGKTLLELGMELSSASAQVETPTTWHDSSGASLRFGLHTRAGETRLLDGSSKTVELGDTTLIVTIARDVTAREHVLDELRASRGFVTEVVDAMPVGFIALDEDFRISFANSLAGELLHAPGLSGRVLWDQFPNARSLPIGEAAIRAMEEQVTLRVEQFYPPSNTWFDVTLRPIHRGLAVYLTDVTGTKDALADATGLEVFSQHVEEADLDRQRRDAARFAAIVATSQDAIMSFSREGLLTSWNPAATRIYGFTEGEALGHTPQSLLIPDGEVDDSTDLIRRAVEGEVMIGVEVRRWRKDGVPVDISMTISPVFDASGMFLGASTIARDITREREVARELQDAEARYRTLVEQVPVIIYDWGISGDIDHVTENYVSPQIEAVLGFTPEEWMADPTLWFTRVHPDDQAAVVAASVRSIEDAAPFSLEYRMIRKDGGLVWIRDEAIVLQRDELGRAKLLQGVQLDITAERTAEQMVHQNAEEKAQLIQLLAHELFTPITSIQGAAMTLSSLGGQLGPNELALLADGVARGATRLRRLVRNLDAAAQLDREDMTLSRKRVTLGGILRVALEEFQPELDAAAILVSSTEELLGHRIVGDRNLFAQAVEVVIENALDYSAGEPVDVQISYDGEGEFIQVSDRGPGIASEQREHIFELFAQVDSSDTRSHEGLGVGLFLARRVMRLHGGDLRYEQRPDGGSRFTFRFSPAGA